MASQVEICNWALTALGVDRITSITEDRNQAQTLNSLWDVVRRAELSGNPWAFAKRLATLAALSNDTPPHSFSTYYQLPAGFLRLVEIGDRKSNGLYWSNWVYGRIYDIYGNRIATDLEAPLDVTYIEDVEDTGRWSALFAQAMAASLAVSACVSLTESGSKLESVTRWYNESVANARRQNAIQLPPRQIGGDDEWSQSRWVYGAGYRGFDEQ